jgi:hypothetical protein
MPSRISPAKPKIVRVRWDFDSPPRFPPHLLDELAHEPATIKAKRVREYYLGGITRKVLRGMIDRDELHAIKTSPAHSGRLLIDRRSLAELLRKGA